MSAKFCSFLTLAQRKFKKNVFLTNRPFFQRCNFTDRSFRLANVIDIAYAQKYKDRIASTYNKYWIQQSEYKPRDITKQMIIDLSHEQGYRRGHIPGAVNLPIEDFDFTRNIDIYGGINQDQIVSVMKNLGITDETSEIILYDNSGLLSCRFWFILRYFGFRNVRILNGGWRAWLTSGLPISEEIVKPKISNKFTNLKPKRTYLLTKPTQMVFDFQHKTSKYIDTRPFEAYQKYHIDGAINLPSKLFMEDSTFANMIEIRDTVADHKLSFEDRMIMYSTQSLSSCITLFALNMVGINHISLYDAGLENWKFNNGDQLNIEQQSHLQH